MNFRWVRVSGKNKQGRTPLPGADSAIFLTIRWASQYATSV
jgi:hypothetical protein